MNAFSLLGLPVKFDVSPAAITAAYLSRAQLAHPDAEPGLPPDERDGTAGDPGDGDDASFGHIEQLNQAKALLLDDERRANLVLDILGGPSASADRSLPPDLLGEVLEQRSKLAEATAAGDSSGIAELRAWAASKRAEHLALVSKLFGAHALDPKPESLKQARTELNALRYIERMLEQVA